MVKSISIALLALLFNSFLRAQTSSGIYQVKSSEKFYFSKYQYDDFGNIYNLNVCENGETVITKVNSCGTKIWSKKISQIHQNALRSASADRTQFMFIGNFIYVVLDQYYSTQFRNRRRFLIHCFTTNGELKWSKIFPLKNNFDIYPNFNGFVDSNGHLILAYYSYSLKSGSIDSLLFNILNLNHFDGKILAQNTWLETNCSGSTRLLSIPVVKVNYDKNEIAFFRYTALLLEKTVLELSSLKLKGHYKQSAFTGELFYRKAFVQNNENYYLTGYSSVFSNFGQILKFSDSLNTTDFIEIEKKYDNDVFLEIVHAENNFFWIFSNSTSNAFIDGYALSGLKSRRFKHEAGRMHNVFHKQGLDVYKDYLIFDAQVHAGNFANTQNFNVLTYENGFCGDTLPTNWKLLNGENISLNWSKENLKAVGSVFLKDTTFEVDNSDFKIKKICGADTWLPADFLPKDTLICSNSHTINPHLDTLKAKFNWSTGDTTKQINIENSGYYFLTLSNSFCSVTDSVKIIFLQKPIEGLKENYTICKNDSLELKIKNAEYFKIITPAFDTLRLVVSKKVYYFQELGSYQVNTNENTPCPLNYAFELKQSKVTVALPPDTLVCSNKDVLISQNTNYKSYWYVNGWLSDSLKKAYLLNQLNDTIIALKLIDSFGCSAFDSMRVKVYDNLKVTTIFDSAYNCNADSFMVHIESDGGKKPYQYYYNNEEFAKDSTKVDYKNEQIAPYRLTITDACGKEWVFSTAISNDNSPRLNVHFQGRDTLLLGAQIHASATVNIGSIEWYVNKSYFGLGKSIIYQPIDTGYYVLKTIAKHKYCLDSAQRKYYVTQPFLYVPNVFSPNSDADNEYWMPICYKCHVIDFVIFNRWGQKVFSGQKNEYWNGKDVNGENFPVDMYLAIVNYMDETGKVYTMNTPVYIYK